MRISVLVLLLALVFISCKSKYPHDILQPGEIEPILLDVIVAAQLKQADTSQATRQHLKDSITAEVQRVLRAHHVDDSLYFKSMDYYEAHPDYLKKVLDSARAYGSWLQDSLQRRQQIQKDSTHNGEIQKNPKSTQPSEPKVPKKPENLTVKGSRDSIVENVKKSAEKK